MGGDRDGKLVMCARGERRGEERRGEERRGEGEGRLCGRWTGFAVDGI